MVIKKILKALYAKNNVSVPHALKAHDLLYLAEKMNLEVTEKQAKDRATYYNSCRLWEWWNTFCNRNKKYGNKSSIK